MTAPAGSEDAGLVLSAEEREVACEVMHDAYEVAAVSAGWKTQQASREPWNDVPEANKATMRKAVDALLAYLATRNPPPAGDTQGSQEARNGPVSDGDAGDGRGHGRDDESGRGAGL